MPQRATPIANRPSRPGSGTAVGGEAICKTSNETPPRLSEMGTSKMANPTNPAEVSVNIESLAFARAVEADE